MRTLDHYTLLPDAARRMRYVALLGIWGGKDHDPYFESCRWQLLRYLAIVIFTRDTGYHTSGWWKNPLYERCWHLSISFPGGTKKNVRDKLIDLLFGQHKKLLWTEPPYSDTGKQLGVWHYRLFCDENWQPIMPKGEVYSTQFTERGWKSFSELNAP